MKKLKTKPEINKAVCTASIKVFGKVYTATGPTVSEAIANLNPGNVKGISVLSVSNNNTKRDKILSAPQTFRLFSKSRLMREIALKNVTLMFT